MSILFIVSSGALIGSLVYAGWLTQELRDIERRKKRIIERCENPNDPLEW